MYEIRHLTTDQPEEEGRFKTIEEATEWAADTLPTDTPYGVVNLETGEVVCIVFQGLEYWP